MATNSTGGLEEDELPGFALESTGLRIVSSFALATTFMLIGHLVREYVSCTRRIYLPAALIAGILALVFIQVVSLNDDAAIVLQHDWIVGWSNLPGFLINIIFATLFMGTKVPTIKHAWKLAGPQLAYGQILAWGNWTVATLFTIILLRPAFDVNELFGSLFPVGFEGGHGTAAGLKQSYINLDFPQGADLAVTSATIGILIGILLGTVVVNIGQHMGWTYASWLADQDDEDGDDIDSVGRYNSRASADMEAGGAKTLKDGAPADIVSDDGSRHDEEDTKSTKDRSAPDALPAPGESAKPKHKHFHRTWRDKAVLPPSQREVGSYLVVSSDAIDTMAHHIALIGLAVFFAYWTKRALMELETLNDWLIEYAFLSGFPLFPIAMLWGGVVQAMFGASIDRGTMERISGAALDFLVLTAVATTKTTAVADSLGPLFILLIIGIVWQLLAFFFIAPILLPDFWFERAIAEMGKSMGTTATGLMLLRMIDPRMETPVLEAFSTKQLLNEPFMGGGLWTSLALPIIAAAGNWAVFGISMGFIALWLAVWFFIFRKEKLGPMVQYKFVKEYNPMD